MPPFRKPTLYTLRRHDLSQPWGFRLAGGANQGQPFHFQKIIPDSIAYKSGLREGDLLVRIGNITLKGLTHEEVQEIILRCVYTVDLFVLRNSEPESEPRVLSPTQDRCYSPLGLSSNSPRSLTEQVLNRMADKDNFYASDLVDLNMMSPPVEQQSKQVFVKERDAYEFNEYSSPTHSKSPQSPVMKPPTSGRPFSPTISPSNISYHQPEEQQWLSSQQQLLQQQQQHQRDARVFGTNPRTKSPTPNTSPVQPTSDQQKDTRVFGVKPRGNSPYMNGSRPTTASSGPSPTPSPVQERPQSDPKGSGSASPAQDIIQQNTSETNQKQLFRPNSLQEKQFYGQNRGPEAQRRGEIFRFDKVMPPHRRVFSNNWRQKMGGSLDETNKDWKESLPQLKSVHPDTNQLLPSHIKREQTYIVQTPPTERNARPPPTGTIRRRIRPVWPPPDYSGNPAAHRSGFNRGESPSRKYEWPPSREGSVDRDYEDGTMSPRMRYSTPPPGWNPRSGIESPRDRRSFTPTRRVKNNNWPPPSNATPAGPCRFNDKITQSLPGSRRGSQSMDTSDFYVYTMNSRVPQAYRPPPNTQLYEQNYYYETE